MLSRRITISLALLLGILASFAFPALAQNGNKVTPKTIPQYRAATYLLMAQGGGLGSAFAVVNRDNETIYLVTAAHCVVKDGVAAENVVVAPADRDGKVDLSPSQQETLIATVKGCDKVNDVAVLSIKAPKNVSDLSFLKPARANENAAGTPIYVFGFPVAETKAQLEGVVSATTSEGSVSKIDVKVQGVKLAFEYDANVTNGNSGGPVVSAMTGHALGVVSFGFNAQDVRAKANATYKYAANIESAVTLLKECGLTDQQIYGSVPVNTAYQNDNKENTEQSKNNQEDRADNQKDRIDTNENKPAGNDEGMTNDNSQEQENKSVEATKRVDYGRWVLWGTLVFLVGVIIMTAFAAVIRASKK